MRKISTWLTDRTVPFFLLIATVAAFGLLLPELGFYWDDWAKILVSRLWDLKAYFAYYAEDRPLSSWTHILFTPILGEGPLGWHLFTLLLRWLSAWGAWWSLNGLWPTARRQNLMAALLFLVYPVFIQQSAALTFHQQWLQYALFFLSFGAMIYSIRSASRRKALLLAGLALAAEALQLSVTEYFAPLELLRPFALWILFGALGAGRPGWRGRTRAVLKAWAPYLALLTAYVIWRLFLIELPGADPYKAETLYNFIHDPLGTLQVLAVAVVTDELQILIHSWGDLLYFETGNATRFTLISYAIGLAMGGAVGLFLYFYRRSPEFDSGMPEPAAPAVDQPLVKPTGHIETAAQKRSWTHQAAWLGLAAVLLGPAPAWITGRLVVFDFHSDRYAMPAMFGAALLLAALVDWLTARHRLQSAVVIGLMVTVAVGLHLRIANDYRWLWTDEQRFFWQLSYRAPGLKGGTAIFLEEEPFPNQGLFSTSAALNLVYPQPEGYGLPVGEGQLAYWIYTLRPRYHSAPASLEIGLKTTFRTLTFTGKTPNSLLLYKDSERGNCVWVLSERDALHPELPALVREFLPISNLDRILPEGAPGYPPEELLGAEPERSWCYYFEKADLARQYGDWDTVAGLADQAAAAGYAPNVSGSNSPYEWLPMIEGLARVGRVDEALALTQKAYERSSRYADMLCVVWSEQENSAAAASAQSLLGCGN